VKALAKSPHRPLWGVVVCVHEAGNSELSGGQALDLPVLWDCIGGYLVWGFIESTYATIRDDEGGILEHLKILTVRGKDDSALEHES
jgi:hypothetical protein